MKLITIAIIFTLAVSVATGYLVYQEFHPKNINFGGININSEHLNDLTEPIGEGPFVLCSIKDDKCSVSIKRGLG